MIMRKRFVKNEYRRTTSVSGLFRDLGSQLIMFNKHHKKRASRSEINDSFSQVCNVAILAQSSADFALTYNFQGTHILGASRGHLCDSVIILLIRFIVFPDIRLM